MLEINLTPYRQQQKLATQKKYLVIYLVVFALTLTSCAGAFLFIDNNIKQYNDEKNQLQSELNALNKKIGKVNQYKKSKKALEQKVSALSILQGLRRGPVRILDELVSSLDEKVWIETLKETKATLALNGYGLTEESVANFMRNLGQSEHFGAVDLSSVEKTKKGSTTVFKFGLNIELSKAVEANENE